MVNHILSDVARKTFIVMMNNELIVSYDELFIKNCIYIK